MTSIFTNYPYATEDEPSDSWTVEQVLQYCLLQAHRETDEKYNQIEKSLKQQFEKGKAEIWNCHKRSQPESENSDLQNNSTGDFNASESKPTRQAALSTIKIEIVGGQYTGNTYTLVPTPRYPCWVGRSQGKKFRERGISFSKDPEISTTHGKFEIRDGKLCYTDTGSTNGSKVASKYLDADDPFPLEEGTEITLGQSVLRVHFP